jgi:HEAT repeat protein
MAKPTRRRRLRRAVIAAILGLLAPHAVAGPGPKNKKPGKVDVAAAKAALLGTDEAKASQAAEALGSVKEQAAHDALLDALSSGLSVAVAPKALAGLVTAPAPADVGVVRIYAKHRSAAVRAAADAALSGYPEGRKLLVRALGDSKEEVRAAAAGALARAKAREGTERMFALLAKGDDGAVAALATMADPEMARAIGEELGKVPDNSLAKCLGLILKRTDFGPDEARVQVVRAIAKIAGTEAIDALSDYVEATPAKPPRASRKEAEQVVQARLGGGDK